MPRWLAFLLYASGVGLFIGLARYTFHDRPWGIIYVILVPLVGASIYYGLERQLPESVYRGKTKAQIASDFAVMALVLGLFAMCWAATVRYFDER